jgi:hypothetical protein
VVATIQRFFGQTPAALLGDTPYGHGRHRMKLAQQGTKVVAPVQQSSNPRTKGQGITFLHRK